MKHAHAALSVSHTTQSSPLLCAGDLTYTTDWIGQWVICVVCCVESVVVVVVVVAINLRRLCLRPHNLSVKTNI